MRIGNCLLYVLARLARGGGRMIVQKSRHGWWPHFLHGDARGCITEFVPLAPRDGKVLPPPLFRGEVRTWGLMVEKTPCHTESR